MAGLMPGTVDGIWGSAQRLGDPGLQPQPAAQVTVSFRWERMADLLDEPNLQDMLDAHWHELGVHKDEMPLDPDYQRYVELNDVGLFRVWAGRDGGTLVAYLAFFIQPHLHYRQTLTAVEDLFMLAPTHRKGMTGIKMFTSAFEALKDLGVRRLICHSKTAFQAERGGLSRLFERLGFEQTDLIWSRML